MSKHAVVFPGQGSQFVGMASEHYASNPEVKKWFDRANEILGINLTEIMFDGPAEKLTQTEFTQPAIYLHSVSAFFMNMIKPDMVAGHSLGEFSALTVAGVISFEDGLKLVRLRGQYMQRAGEMHPGSMAAVIGLDDTLVEEICDDSSQAIGLPVVAANYNCPGQLVISGDTAAVEHAMEALKAAGSRMVKLLPVSGAFHSALMESAYDPLAKAMEDIIFNPAKFPVYANYTAMPSVDPDSIKSNTLNQLLNPVRWTQTLLRMYDDGARTFTEVGPGTVLKGMIKRTLTDVETQGFS